MTVSLLALATGQPLAQLYGLDMDDFAALEEALRIRNSPPPAKEGTADDLMRIFDG